jgi:hypothetical protein
VWCLPDGREAWGDEIKEGTNFYGRRRIVLSHSGYHWLAYSWKNYVLTCERCNTVCKGSFFPVIEPPARCLPPKPGIEAEETALLINPFDGPSPAEHLKFSDLGLVDSWNGSRHGWETLRTYGLYRQSLIDVRAPVGRRVYHLIQTFRFSEDEKEKDKALDDLQEMGRADRAHAGMVRTMFEQHTELRWADLFGDDEAEPAVP